jgi:hypothetical protein
MAMHLVARGSADNSPNLLGATGLGEFVNLSISRLLVYCRRSDTDIPIREMQADE